MIIIVIPNRFDKIQKQNENNIKTANQQNPMHCVQRTQCEGRREQKQKLSIIEREELTKDRKIQLNRSFVLVHCHVMIVYAAISAKLAAVRWSSLVFCLFLNASFSLVCGLASYRWIGICNLIKESKPSKSTNKQTEYTHSMNKSTYNVPYKYIQTI